MYFINESILSSDTGTVTFSSIPQNFTHLQLRCFVRGASAPGSPTSLGSIYVRFNGDGGTNYSNHDLYSDGGTAGVTNYTNDTVIRLSRCAPLANNTANYFGVGIFDIFDYTSATKHKTSTPNGGCDTNHSASGGGAIVFGSGCWRNTAAINSITIFTDGNLVTGSRMSLYGLDSKNESNV
jgi:hypothetical protein